MTAFPTRKMVDADSAARPWSDFVHRVYTDLRLSRRWEEPRAVPLPELETTALCGGVTGEPTQFVVPFSTQRSVYPSELEEILRAATAAGAMTAVLAVQDSHSLVVYLELSEPIMDLVPALEPCATADSTCESAPT